MTANLIATLTPIDQIDIPKNWRKVKKETVSEIAESIKADGLLQPIGVRPIGDRFRLVLGRHRLDAFKLNGETEIPAFHMDLDDIAEMSATDAENLFRNPLSPAERLISLKRWHQRYVEAHPESHGGAVGPKVRDAARKGESFERAPAFAQHAAEVTGAAQKTIEMQVGFAKEFDEEELYTLADRDVPQDSIRKLAGIKDKDQRRAAVTLIGSGLSPVEAMATATAPANATITHVERNGVTVKDEADMTDDEWLNFYCSEILAKLKYSAIFRRDAILYRHSSDARHKFRASMKKLLSQGKGQLVGSLYLLMARLVNTDHPKNWLHCGPCGGTGMSGDNSKCGTCNGHAYSTRTGAR